jgi:hypothetical protein
MCTSPFLSWRASSRVSVLTLSAILIACNCIPAIAAPQLSVNAFERDTVPGSTPINVTNTVNGPPLQTAAFPNPSSPLVIDRGTPGINYAHGQLFVIARPSGALGVTTDIGFAEGPPDLNTATQFTALASYRFDDMIVSPTPGSTFANGNFLKIKLRFDVDGSFATNGFESLARANLTVSTTTTAFQGATPESDLGGHYDVFTEAKDANNAISFIERTGMFADPGQTISRTDGTATALSASIHQTVETAEFNIVVGIPFKLELSVTADSLVAPSGGFDHYAGSASLNFGNTFQFATAGPVADLPDGLTLNSAQASIVNNTSSVPEPASSAFLLLLYPARRRLSRRSESRRNGG